MPNNIIEDSLTAPNPVFEQLRGDRSNEPMLQFFQYEHLPNYLQDISKPFCDLAREIVRTLPCNPERSAGLRKLIEAKDCAVRARLYKFSNSPFPDQG